MEPLEPSKTHPGSNSTSRNFREILYFLNYLKENPIMQASAELDLSTKQLADALGCTPRMVNIYRAAIEQETGRNLGYKSGKTTYFRPKEQHAIAAQRERGVDTREVGAEAQARASQPVTTAPGEEGMNEGMAAIVKQSDQQAIAMGQMLGHRFNSLLMGTMMDTIATGFTEIQQTMTEVTASIQCGLPAAPALGAGTVPLALGGTGEGDGEEYEVPDIDYYGESGSTAGNGG
jgi:hypothetical protein